MISDLRRRRLQEPPETTTEATKELELGYNEETSLEETEL